ncbi:DNA-binding protein stimulates sugar fermentation-like protein [Paenibacillus curdlanolyticus YK9]|uniref:DNA-binding protein stimulates sugar fermentation-like protein n=1 Tax=Paenibacillus curdlanolyticus YK9 TaxID=717606 RepID=E0IAE0_9BACL|nr:DNA/RNA nuclease SfsA [Paenibacillus curdlanolyticus]EFM10717.1 DNA-binding protein stimulates sugar fermentation-like protein [Paenibacillus curdlanolyticus YK9]
MYFFDDGKRVCGVFVHDITKGTFIKESKNRFLCTVMIDGLVNECYVPSSSRIENYLKLKNREVLLTKNKSKNRRTEYSLFAVKYYNKYILVNLNMVNSIVQFLIQENKLKSLSSFSIKREHIINGYKTDLLIENDEGNRNIIEVKGVISSKQEVMFPSVYSERAIFQLSRIKQLLHEGEKVTYIITSLSPTVRRIKLDDTYREYYHSFKECLDLGMQTQAFSVNFHNGEIIFGKRIRIIL